MRTSKHTDLSENEIKNEINAIVARLAELPKTELNKIKADAILKYDEVAYQKACKDLWPSLKEYVELSDRKLFLWMLLTSFTGEDEV